MYDVDFYREETRVAAESAHHALPIVFAQLPPTRTVIDVGCGTGAWAREAQNLGRAAVGVDHAVPPELRVITTFIDCDLSNGYPCAGFDLAICLEVADFYRRNAFLYRKAGQ